MAPGVSRIRRRPFAVLGKLKDLPSGARACLTCSHPSSRFTSSHRRPNSSPRRIPVWMTSTYSASHPSSRAASKKRRAWTRLKVGRSFLSGRGGATASVTLRGTSSHLTACLSAECSTVWMYSTVRFDKPDSSLDLPSIGWQLFILDSSQSDPIALPAFLDTYATRLLTEPLNPFHLKSMMPPGQALYQLPK